MRPVSTITVQEGQLTSLLLTLLLRDPRSSTTQQHEPEEINMSSVSRAPNAVKRYFEADAERDIDAIVELFAGDATVIDEGQTRRGPDEIREWQAGPASPTEK